MALDLDSCSYAGHQHSELVSSGPIAGRNQAFNHRGGSLAPPQYLFRGNLQPRFRGGGPHKRRKSLAIADVINGQCVRRCGLLLSHPQSGRGARYRATAWRGKLAAVVDGELRRAWLNESGEARCFGTEASTNSPFALSVARQGSRFCVPPSRATSPGLPGDVDDLLPKEVLGTAPFALQISLATSRSQKLSFSVWFGQLARSILPAIHSAICIAGRSRWMVELSD